jgi:hypothetical protein
MATFSESLAAPTPEALKRIEEALKRGDFPGGRSRSPGMRRKSTGKGQSKGQRTAAGPSEEAGAPQGNKPSLDQYFASDGEDQEANEKDCQNTIKSVLNCQQRLRASEGALFNTHLLEFDSTICVVGLSVAETYGLKAKANPHAHGLGPPHLHIGMKMLGEILKLTESIVSVKKYREPILAWHTEANKSVLQEDIADTLRHWQIKRCFNKEGQDPKFRLTYLLYGIYMVDLKPMMMQTIMANLLRETPNIERKVGAAPPPKLERDNQATLKKLLGR